LIENVPDVMPVWRVELDPVLADEWRRDVGSDRRAAEVESDWLGKFGDPAPVDARLLRVEPDEAVGIFVERTWPHADYGYRRAMKDRLLRETVPVRQPDDWEGPTLIAHVAWVMREAGALSDEPSAAEVEYWEREPRVPESPDGDSA
jgi:hypothetical protein